MTPDAALYWVPSQMNQNQKGHKLSVSLCPGRFTVCTVTQGTRTNVTVVSCFHQNSQTSQPLKLVRTLTRMILPITLLSRVLQLPLVKLAQLTLHDWVCVCLCVFAIHHWGIESKFSLSFRVMLGIRLTWSSTQLPTQRSISERTAGSLAPESKRSFPLSLQCIVHLVRRS